MSRDVSVVDYGRGNLFSVCRALEAIGAEPSIVDSPDKIRRSGRLVLPGVGAFGDAMTELLRNNLAEAIQDFVSSGGPLLGICLGAQMLLDSSHEFGVHGGLGLIPGEVKRLPKEGNGFKIPNVGWCRLKQPDARSWDGSLLEQVADGTYAYFVHSFEAVPTNPDHVLAVQAFGGHQSAAVIARDNIAGCQFHPEKSGPAGHKILAAWLTL